MHCTILTIINATNTSKNIHQQNVGENCSCLELLMYDLMYDEGVECVNEVMLLVTCLHVYIPTSFGQ